MDLKLLLCFVMISPIFGDNLYPQTPQELIDLDRARSAWNFGGHHAARISNKKVALNQWGRERSSVPASVITNRRQGTLPKVTGITKKKSIRSSSPGLLMQPRQYNLHPKPVKPGKRNKVNRNVQSPSSPSAAAPQTYSPHPFYNQQQSKPMLNRGSRMMNSRSDTILNKFRKEDLWHLDKGEGYPLRNQDLEYDDFQRNYRKRSLGVGTKSIDDQHATPNLMRRRRSTDSQQQQQQPQSQSQIFQMLNGNQRMSPHGTRKHYSNHIGNGKTPLSQSQTMNSHLKVPATIIAPPSFDKADLLSMLMGSGGVNPNEMGTILATNSRYVRFGRGLPNSAPGTRQGRNLQWFSDSPKNHYHSKNPSASSMASISSQQPSTSSSNHIPSMVKVSAPPSLPSSMVNQNQYSASSPPKPQNPQVSSMLSPPPPQYKNSMKTHPKQHQQPSNNASPPQPLVLNVHIAPVGPRPNRGPVITFPAPNSPPVKIPSSSHSYQYDVTPSPSVKPEKQGKGFKSSENWKPVSQYKETKKPFKYDYSKPKYNDEVYSSSESKLSYSKVKPEKASLLEQFDEDEVYQNEISYNDKDIEKVPSVEYSDNDIQNTDNEYVGESSPSANEEIPGYDTFSSAFEQDQNTEEESKVNNNIKTYSFAVKNKNEMKTGLDFDILSASSPDYDDDTFSMPAETSKDKSYFDSHISEGTAIHSSDLRMSETISSRNQNFDNNYYYSLVRQLAGHGSEPIIINVPKDGPMSNEVKK